MNSESLLWQPRSWLPAESFRLPQRAVKRQLIGACRALGGCVARYSSGKSRPRVCAKVLRRSFKTLDKILGFALIQMLALFSRLALQFLATALDRCKQPPVCRSARGQFGDPILQYHEIVVRTEFFGH